MKIIGNILWHFLFLGFIDASANYLVGLLLCITVVAAPIGLGLMEYGKFLFAPFSHKMVSKSEAGIEEGKFWKTYSTVVSVIYFPFGFLILLLTIIHMTLLFISIIGIPAALVLLRSLGTCLNPVGKKCVLDLNDT